MATEVESGWVGCSQCGEPIEITEEMLGKPNEHGDREAIVTHCEQEHVYIRLKAPPDYMAGYVAMAWEAK